ncbi:MAG: hypothetical protein LBH85_00030 [Treponema sp.]|nr:hypothetical protein [Treponema sp.]
MFAEEPAWKVVDLVDEFDDPTGSKCLVALVSGKFSNSFASNSKLDVYIFVDGVDECYFLFYEYGISNANARWFYSDFFSFTVKDGEGVKSSFYREVSGYGTRFVSVGANFLSILEKGGLVQVSVKVGSTSYRFDVDTSGFVELFSAMF